MFWEVVLCWVVVKCCCGVDVEVVMWEWCCGACCCVVVRCGVVCVCALCVVRCALCVVGWCVVQ